MSPPDILVIGSGISGACAAHRAVELGAVTQLIDIGFDDPGSRDELPDLPFDEIRKMGERQSVHFIGRSGEGIPKPGVVVGAQLTPPRQFIHRRAAELLPFEAGGFSPLLSSALGGLGSGWGAAAFVFSQAELGKAGLPVAEMAAAYQRAARLIGVSGDSASPIHADCWAADAPLQPPLRPDSNAANILGRAAARRDRLAARGIEIGAIPMAVLTEDQGSRRANPYFDMDFYSDSRRSVFRPRYLIEELQQRDNFIYTPGKAVFRIVCEPGQLPAVEASDVATGAVEQFRAKRIILCANAINSGRIALNSLSGTNRRTSLLCGPYTYFPTVNLGMLGRRNDSRRHSLAQFGGLLRGAAGGIDGVFQMYSYRSLLLFKLVKEIPLPPALGLLTARTLASSMAIFGLFLRDELSAGKAMELSAGGELHRPALRFDYRLSAAEDAWKRECEKRLKSALIAIGCIPLSVVDPGAAASIHYAGTIPFDNPVNPGLRTLPSGEIDGLPNVFSRDSASWVSLPAKGLSFTLAANAMRVAEAAVQS